MSEIPFKTPTDYYFQALGGDASKIDDFPDIFPTLGWDGEDADLHVYPHTRAVPGILSMGCPFKCHFCPTYKAWDGKTAYGDYEKIIPRYKNQTVHWMDENFFTHPDLDRVLTLLEEFNVQWLAMSTANTTHRAVRMFGEDRLWDSGCRVVEMGLENVGLEMKVTHEPKFKRIAPYYLNMTFLPGETKETIIETADWMTTRSLEAPIHHNNGLWYAPGQYFYPYTPQDGGRKIQPLIRDDGITLNPRDARTRPTFIPDTFLDQEFIVRNLQTVNHYSQLVYGYKVYNPPRVGSIRSFIGDDHMKAAWLVVGLRTGGIG